jgi:hypothetical protein
MDRNALNAIPMATSDSATRIADFVRVVVRFPPLIRLSLVYRYIDLASGYPTKGRPIVVSFNARSASQYLFDLIREAEESQVLEAAKLSFFAMQLCPS